MSASNAALGGASGNETIKQGAIGTFTGMAGGASGQYAAQGIGSAVIGSLKVTSPVVKGFIGGAIGDGAADYAGGFTADFLMVI